MGQTSTFTIDGGAAKPFREHEEIEIEAIFGIENSASLSLGEVSYVDSDGGGGSNMNTLLKQKWIDNPFEGPEIGIQLQDGADSFSFDFFPEWNNLVFQSAVELKVSLTNINGLSSFDDRSKVVTFALLEAENLLNAGDYQNIPYLVENRKTLLEKIQLLAQGWSILKAIGDEVFKIINIAADISTLGALQAVINLAVTIASLVLLIQQLVNLLGQIQEAFFPITLYHRGIKPKVFIEKGAEYMELDGVDFGGVSIGSFGYIMERLSFCPSKNDEIGFPVNIPTNVSGALKPNNKGYNLFDMLDLLNDKFRIRKAIINNILHIKPESDPFWIQNPSFVMTNVLIEKALEVDNGTFHPNYEDFFNSTILQYATDDSDLWTLQDLADETDPTSAQKIISGVLVKPTSAIDQKRAVTQKGKSYNIPYSLCVRKDVLDELLDTFLGTSAGLDLLKEKVTERFAEFTDLLGQALPGLADFVASFGGRTGAMKVENHFFSVPKVTFLEDTNIGFGTIAPRIPANFADFVGAGALMANFHNWDSFVPGVRNPSDPSDTKARFVYTEVEIPFNLKSMVQVLNNPYFSIQGGGNGKFTRVKWKQNGDTAIVDFWRSENWAVNIEQSVIQTA